MKITKEQPPLPPPEYSLRLAYPDLHNLYHDLLDLINVQGVNAGEYPHIHELFAVVKEHA